MIKYFFNFERLLNKKLLFLLIIPLFLIPVYAQEESNEIIPSWVKSVAGYWSEDRINDEEYIEGLEFLINSNIIKINSTQSINSLPNEEKRLYELELDQKDNKISLLENELKEVGLNNSQMLLTIVSQIETIESLKEELDKTKEDFQQYKDDYPLKVGNIGGAQVNVNTVKQLQENNDELRETIKKLEEEIKELEK